MHAISHRISNRGIIQFLAGYAALRETVSFIQVGSNDASLFDPLRPHLLARDWRGLMIEPVPYVFERLVRNYGHLQRLALANVAVSDTDGERDFFYLPHREGLPAWHDQLGSFYESVILSHDDEIPGIAQYIVRQRVPTRRLDSLCREYQLPKPQLIHIDTEGHDYAVLQQIDFEAWQPEVVLYEHKHLKEDARDLALSLLDHAGYVCHPARTDTLAIRQSLLFAQSSVALRTALLENRK